MKHQIKIISLFLLSLLLIYSCKKDSTEPDDDETPDDDAQYEITVNFEYGVDFSYSNIYVIWAQNTSTSFIQNLSICERLLDGTLTGTALPYWHVNVYPSSDNTEVDAVTGATQAKTDFSVSADMKDNTVREFTLYFETDRSYNPNDWFIDQPALLYAVDINLDDDVSEYELEPVGWTPNEKTENVIDNTPMGTLQTEMRYITHHQSGDSFGDVDDLGATRMVERITVTIEEITEDNL